MAIEKYGIADALLMENAGLAAYSVLLNEFGYIKIVDDLNRPHSYTKLADDLNRPTGIKKAPAFKPGLFFVQCGLWA